VRLPPETRIQRWRRWWHLHGTGWTHEYGAPALMVAGFFLTLWGVRQGLSLFGSWVWMSTGWGGHAATAKTLTLGIVWIDIGLFFLWIRVRRGERVRRLGEMRRFVVEARMIAAGAWLVMKARGIL